MKTLILTQKQVRELVSMDLAVPAVERAFEAHGKGETLMPSKVYLTLDQFGGDFRAMPAFADGSAGVKWVNSHPANPERHGLPAVMGTYILSDPGTAEPLAILDATYITAARTGAAAAVAAKYLAIETPRTVGFIGCGVQARTMLAALRVVYGDGLEVLGADVRDDAAKAFASEVNGKAVSLAEAAGCDIVCTATPVREPIVRREWLCDHAHVNAMGADAEGKQELETSILEHGRVVIDDVEQASHSGEINVPLHRGELRIEDVYGTLGQIVAGAKPGRSERNMVTIFDSTGLAVQDVALARLAYEQARSRGIGLEVDLVGG